MKKLAVLFLIVFGIILTGAGLIENEFISVAVGIAVLLWGVFMATLVWDKDNV